MEVYYIYYIECLINNKKYVGSCLDFIDREKRHFSMLKNNSHYNKAIQNDYNKYGIENFKFNIIEEIKIFNYDLEINLVIDKENYYMDFYKTHIPTYGIQFGYNRQSATRLNNKQIKNLSNSLKGKFDGELNPFYGKTHTDEVKLKLRKGFTTKDCLDIMELLYKGVNYRDIAKIKGCSRNIPYQIKNNKHWSNKEIGTYEEYIKKREGN